MIGLNINRGRVLVVTFGLLVVFFLGFVYLLVEPIFSQPDNESKVKVVQNVQQVEVPKEITAGQPFKYHVKGEKLVNNTATVKRQVVCTDDGAQATISIDEIESNQKPGKFDVTREMVIPVSQRLKSSPNCHLEFIATFTFYQVSRFGDESSFNIKVHNQSNNFKLIVPDQASAPGMADNAIALLTEPYGLIPEKEIVLAPEPLRVVGSPTSTLVADAAPAPSNSKTTVASQNNTGLVPWIYKVVSNTGTQLGVYNLPINAVRKYDYVDGKAKIITKEGVDVTTQLVTENKL